MQGLSAFRVAHSCCPSSLSGRFPTASPPPRLHLLLLGFHQRSSFFQCASKEAFAPAPRKLKTSPQDEPATEDDLPPLAEEEVSTKLAEEEIPTNNAALEEGPKINVKFILEKKCRFGQKFNVVGNNPQLGNWVVKAAIPMKWAEGDIWTAEVDVPAEKEVEFKFVLTGENEEIEWQPGSNRVFNTIEGISSLVVNEAWKSAEDAEEEEAVGESSDLVEDATSPDTGGLLVPADITEDGAVDEVVKALESNITKDGAVDEVVKALQSKNGGDEPKPAAPEIPLAELDVAATAVKTALGVDDAA